MEAPPIILRMLPNCPDSDALGRQEPIIPRMRHQPASGLHQPLLQARQRPVIDYGDDPKIHGQGSKWKCGLIAGAGGEGEFFADYLGLLVQVNHGGNLAVAHSGICES